MGDARLSCEEVDNNKFMNKVVDMFGRDPRWLQFIFKEYLNWLNMFYQWLHDSRSILFSSFSFLISHGGGASEPPSTHLPTPILNLFTKSGRMLQTIKDNIEKSQERIWCHNEPLQIWMYTLACKIELFSKCIKPYILYGCELWGIEDRTIIEKCRLKY